MVCGFLDATLILLNNGIHSEFAEYTSAQERIALGKKSRKAEAKKRREEMESLIADTCGNPPAAFIVLTPRLGWKTTKKRRNGNRNRSGEQAIVTILPRPRCLHRKYTSRRPVRGQRNKPWTF